MLCFSQAGLLQTQQDACLSRLVGKHQQQQQQQQQQHQQQQSPSALSHSPLAWSYNRLQNHGLLRTAHTAGGSGCEVSPLSPPPPLSLAVLASGGDCPQQRATTATSTSTSTSTLAELQACDTNAAPGALAPQKGHAQQDLGLQDLAADDLDVQSNHSQLESESVYLPVSGETPPSPLPTKPLPPRPHSRLPATSPTPTPTGQPHPHISSVPPSSAASSPATASSSSPRSAATGGPESRYEWKERREIRPLNQEIVRGKLRANFPLAAPPRASDAEPRTHTPRLDRPPTTAASQDYDMSLDTSSSQPPSSLLPAPASSSSSSSSSSSTTTTTTTTTATSVPPSQVSLIHRVVDSKRGAKLRQQQQSMRHTPPPSGPGPQPSQIPVMGQQQQQQQQQQQAAKGGRGRVKGLDSNRQAELSKLLKCQQNAERLNQHRDRPAPGVQLSTDSGFQSRPSSDAVLTDCGHYGQEGQRAAVAIQSVWRGYWAREHSLQVVSVRKEIRARRAEDHIVLLRAELDRHKKLYNEEKRLRTLQMEAIRCLYHEVQQLKSHMQGGSSASGSRPGTADSLGSASLGQSGASTGSDLQRTAELERTCQSLQNQVWELQQTLHNMTSHVFRQDSMELNSLASPTATTDQLTMVQVLECREGQIPASQPEHQAAACYWSSIPHSLSPYPSEEEEMYFRQVPHHGAPTPPRSLGLQHKSEQSVLLHWLPSRPSIDHTSDLKPWVTGYRVYINDQPKGTVGNQKTMALVCGLYPSATYKFYIRAVSSAGESYESNIVVARLARGNERQRPSDTSDSEVPPDSDKDRDSSDVVDKRRLRKREGRKHHHHHHRKARSPRSEKKTTTTTKAEDGEEKGEGKEGGGGGGGQRHGGESSPAAGILTHAKLHKHRRTPSKEQSELSSLQSDSNPSTPSRPGEDTHQRPHTTPPPSSTSRSTPPPPPPPSQARSTPTPTKELTQGDVVRQRRAGSPARDLSFKSPSPTLERKVSGGVGGRSSPGVVVREGSRPASVPNTMDEALETPVVLSETFDVDKAKSFLRNLTTPPNVPTADGPSSAEASGGGGFVKGHHRKRSKDLNAESGGGGSGSGSGSVAPHKDRSSPDRGSSGGHPEEGAKVKTHRRTRSRDLHTPTPTPGDEKEEEGGGRGEKERSNTPVLDGRRRAGSRPSSPMIFDGPSLASEPHRGDLDSPLAELSRRKTIAENLVQRLRKCPSPSGSVGGGGGGREQEEGEKVSPQYGNRSRKQSPGSDSQAEGQEDSGRPSRHRTHSVGSEGDLVCVGGDRKLYSSAILSTLDMLESKLTERRRQRKRSNEEEASVSAKPAGRTRHVSESDNDMSSDPGGHLPPKAPVASDSSSGSHSDDSKARHYRHHRRSPSDQRPLTGSGYSSDQVSGRHTHSPIIMEGGGRRGSSNVRRNASFHALLPSRPHDSQPSPAPEEMAAGGNGASHREEVTSPQESQGNPRSSIRSRSPSPGPNRQPILSGAQLKRHTSDPAKPLS